MLKLALKSIFYYKKRSAAVLAGIALSAALLTGISSLIYSGHQSSIQNCREIYGSWNYMVSGNEETAEHLLKAENAGYRIEKYGILKTAKSKNEQVRLQYADPSYLAMMGQPVLEGSYPKKTDEIAMDRFSLDNLNSRAGIGEAVMLDGRTYRLSGILKDPWSSDFRVLTAFISKDAVGKDADSFVYLKMDEFRKLYKQKQALQKEYADGKIKENGNLNAYFGDKNPERLLTAARGALFEKDADARNDNFIYFVLRANEMLQLSLNGTIMILGLFSWFLIYSLYQIAFGKRMSEYGILKALGIGRMNQFLFVLAELWCLLLIGFPAGTLCGNGAAAFLYKRFDTVFMDTGVVRPAAQHGGNETNYYIDAARLSAHGFQVCRAAVLSGILFLAVFTAFFAWRLSEKIEKQNAMQMIRQLPAERRQKRNRNKSWNKNWNKNRNKNTIYSMKKRHMPDVLNQKFMMERKRSFWITLVSLSLSGALFLCINLVLINAQESSRMQFAADDGLGSDMKIYENNVDLEKTISQDIVDKLKKTNGIRTVYAVKSYICGLLRESDEVLWKKGYASHVNQYTGPPYNGIYNKLKDGRYAVKSNMLGYDETMLGQLKPYILEGEIDPGKMASENEIVVMDLADGMGNYGGFSLRAGSFITLRIPQEITGTMQDLKQEGSYKEMTFQVAAVVKRTLLRDSRLYVDPEVSGDYTFSVIMTQEQMQQNFGIQGYRVLGIEMEEGADGQAVSDAVKRVAAGMEHVYFQDNTVSIKRQKEYLAQKSMFYYGIAVIFFVFSLFHIMNTMNHIIMSRKHEYGILRAMGITDRNLAFMMLRQGLAYGCLSSVFMIVLYLLSKGIAVYFMRHISKFLASGLQAGLWIVAGTAAVNIIAGVLAVMIPVRAVMKEDIIPQINLQ